MSLLSMIAGEGGACDRLKLNRPTTLIGNTTDEVARKMLGLIAQEGKELASRGTWQALTREKTFTTVAQAVQTSAVPSDFDWYIPGTMFNRSATRELEEPLTPQEWQRFQATLSTFVNAAFRFRGNSILIAPTPTAGQTVAYEYMTKNFCTSSGGTEQSAFAADTDLTVLNEEYHILGIVWRWKRSIGVDYAEEFNTYEAAVNQALDRDGARPRISTSPVGLPNEWWKGQGDYTVTP